tara:strand:+ start:2015 stop:3280 length:1266 start_codon:yes stop_codon:yes gene_type:complete
MAIETVASHLTGQRKQRSIADMYEAQTLETQQMLPGKLQKQDLANERSRITNESLRHLYSEMLKDEDLNNIIRRNKIRTEEAMAGYYKEKGPEGLVADILLEKELAASNNQLNLILNNNDMRLNKFAPFHANLKDHFERIGDAGYDAVTNMNRLESQYEMLLAEFTELNQTDVRPRVGPDGNSVPDTEVNHFAFLPGGKAQGEPLTIENFDAFSNVLEVMENYSASANTMLQQRLQQRGATEREQMKIDAKAQEGTGDNRFSVTDTANISKSLTPALASIFPQAFTRNEETGNIVADPSYGSSLETMSQQLTQAITQSMEKNPNINQQQITNMLTKVLDDGIQPYSAETPTLGVFGGDDPFEYKTFVPTEASAKANGITQAQYIERLEATIEKEQGRRDAQSIADEVFRNNFSNMVTFDQQ